MHFDAHIAAEVSEYGQHVSDKFCVFSSRMVTKKGLRDQNKSLPRFQFHFAHRVFKLCIFDELTDLRTVKDTGFQLLYS